MPLAYYSRSATSDFWEEHWGRQSPEALARSAETSPLTDLILKALPPAGARVLEAGCGLGQYVVLLRRRGYHAVGTDWSVPPLRTCRAWAAATPLAVMDLRQLGFRPGSFAAYVSLGVAEHDPEGPDRILIEAHRVLAPSGVLILSVPYVNLARFVGTWWVRRRNRRRREGGGQFYQFAFSRREAREFIERNGFRVLSATPYDPARLLRAGWRRLGFAAPRAADGAPRRESGVEPVGPSVRRTGVQALKPLLYTRAGLHVLGHMILFVAVKR
jgi:SAM-dependent methyltransferase